MDGRSIVWSELSALDGAVGVGAFGGVAVSIEPTAAVCFYPVPSWLDLVVSGPEEGRLCLGVEGLDGAFGDLGDFLVVEVG